MRKDINLQLYEGNGVPVHQRNQTLPDYEPFVDGEHPKNYIAERGLRDAVNFEEIRSLALKKKPATAEFLAWMRVLQSLDIDPKDLKAGQAEALALSYSILAKTQEDLAVLRKKLS